MTLDGHRGAAKLLDGAETGELQFHGQGLRVRIGEVGGR